MTEEAKKAVLMVHLDPDLKKQLAVRAAENGLSMSQIVRAVLAAHLDLLDDFDAADADLAAGRTVPLEAAFAEEA